MNNEERKARLFVYTIVGVFAFIAIFNIFISYLGQGTENLTQQIFKAILILFLCVFVWLGHDWARWGLGILGGLAGLIFILNGINLFSRVNWWFFPVVFGVLYIASAVILFAVPLVRRHFKADSGKLL